MRSVNLSAVDLNLLLVVATVLEERSATRAAARLSVTQSAVSNALRRARELFDDPLVARESHGLAPTPRAESLLPALRGWLDEARRLIADAPAFDAATSERLFTVAATDAVSIALLRPLLAELRVHAPRARLCIATLDRLIADDSLARGDTDLLIGMPPEVPPGHFAEPAYRDALVCIVKRSRQKARLDLARFAAMPHVEVALFGKPDETVDRALARRGLERTVKVAVPHFSSLPLAVLETDGVATVGERVARSFQSAFPIAIVKPPVVLDLLEIRMVWHKRAERDDAVRFLRTLVKRAARARK
jgi:DNA-binding transcriptional LysR family regulator